LFDLIFDTLFDFIQAWDMIGLLIMGAVFIAVGGGFIGYEIYWRVKSIRVDSTIVAIKESGKYYYSIFKYQTPDGQKFEQISSMGSNTILNRLPGKTLSLMIIPGNAEKVRRPTFIWLFFGFIFFLPGLYIMNLAIQKFELNYMVILFIFAALLFGGERLYKFYKKITRTEFDRALLKEAWQGIKSGDLPQSKRSKIKGRILEKQEIIDKALQHLNQYKITVAFLLLVSIGFAIGSYYLANDMIDLTTKGISTNGKIVNIISRDSSDNSGYTYYAEASFKDVNGKTIRFTDSMGASTPLFERGDEIDILYQVENPNDAIIDRGIFNWGFSVGMMIISLWSLWGAFRFLGAKKRFLKHSF
jgi:hypothetical protein